MGEVQEDDDSQGEHEPIIKEIIALERSYFFEKRNVKTERQRKLREIIERHTNAKGGGNDT
jgi:CRISPR/Cas system CMR subunit Cmr4 (Cas7 group RAMP superfamily)